MKANEENEAKSVVLKEKPFICFHSKGDTNEWSIDVDWERSRSTQNLFAFLWEIYFSYHWCSLNKSDKRNQLLNSVIRLILSEPSLSEIKRFALWFTQVNDTLVHKQFGLLSCSSLFRFVEELFVFNEGKRVRSKFE